MSLSNAACRSAKPSGKIIKLSDGCGLQLIVLPSGSKLWWVAYRFGGKQKTLSLGVYPTVSLSDARQERDRAKKLLAKGTDPSVAKKTAKTDEAAGTNTFRTIADEYMAQQRRNQLAATTITKLEWLLSFAIPMLGDKQITDIRPPDVLGVLRKVELRGCYETAHRLRSTIGTVFRFAIASGRAENDPTISLQRALASPPRKHRAAIIEPKAFGALLRAIDGFEGRQPTTKAALQLMALLFPRPGELRAAEWQEFNFEEKVWVIPAARMKMHRVHKIPLSRQALAILCEMQAITGTGRLVFPSIRTTLQSMSECTMNAALRRLGYSKDEMTPHGFRSSASTLLNESSQWNADAIERQLAHVERDDVRGAYLHGGFWEERVRMMTWWADYLDDLKIVGKVIPMGPTMRPVVAAG